MSQKLQRVVTFSVSLRLLPKTNVQELSQIIQNAIMSNPAVTMRAYATDINVALVKRETTYGPG